MRKTTTVWNIYCPMLQKWVNFISVYMCRYETSVKLLMVNELNFNILDAILNNEFINCLKLEMLNKQIHVWLSGP